MSLQRFGRFAAVGVANTLTHWLLFMVLHLLLALPQAWSNLLAFLAAASLSYHLNARYTFVVPADYRRYLLFVSAMGALSLAIGALADWADLPAWLTLGVFSGLSLLIGFGFSQAVVFKRRGP